MFYKVWAYNLEAITEADIDEYVSHYSAPGGMRAGFEYYRAFPIEEEQNRGFSKVKLQMPVLALGGEYSFGTAALKSMKLLATNVSGGTVPFSGHWIAEECPDFLIRSLQCSLVSNNKTAPNVITSAYSKVDSVLESI
jgi:pimeloyl-ACP methyl ester carboxylesterase